jgi:DNA-binding Xre family transcriptional regulator
LIVEAKVADYINKDCKQLKQIYIAEAVGIKKSRFSAIMNGHAEMKVDELLRLCKFLNVAPSEFIQVKVKRKQNRREV